MFQFPDHPDERKEVYIVVLVRVGQMLQVSIMLKQPRLLGFLQGGTVMKGISSL